MVLLNKSLLSKQDVFDFEYETKTKIFYNLPPLYDQENSNPSLDSLLVKLGFANQGGGEPTEDKKGLFGKF